ncbi:MAG TPA: FliH/SctL family protein [Methylomirabilota bacterium]|nr:FliH/SctL family protein [Methylomirabilota bacterium]
MIRLFPSRAGTEQDWVVEPVSFPNLERMGEVVPADTEETAAHGASTIEADARQEARRILLATRREAQQLLDKARQEAEEIRARAWAEGLALGQTQARDEARREVFPLLEILRHSSKELEGLRQLYSGQLETQIPTLTVLLTKKVIHRELQLDRSTIVGIVRAALERVSAVDREVTLRVHPDDAEVLAKHRTDLLSGLDKIPGIRFEADASITPGGCLVETASGLIDARLETQLEEAARVLEGQGER